MGKTRLVFIDTEAKVNSSYYCNIILEKGLPADIRAICRHYRWTLQQDRAPAHTARTTMDYLKKSASTSLNLTCGLQIALILIPWIIWDALQQRVYRQREFKTVEELKRTIVTEWQKLSQRFIDNSILKLISRMAADTSSIATWLEQPHIILILSKDMFSQ